MGDPKRDDTGGDGSGRGDNGLARRRWKHARGPRSCGGLWLKWRKVVAALRKEKREEDENPAGLEKIQ